MLYNVQGTVQAGIPRFTEVGGSFTAVRLVQIRKPKSRVLHPKTSHQDNLTTRGCPGCHQQQQYAVLHPSRCPAPEATVHPFRRSSIKKRTADDEEARQQRHLRACWCRALARCCKCRSVRTPSDACQQLIWCTVLFLTFFSVMTYRCINWESKCRSGLTGELSSTATSPYSRATFELSTTT
jgi:hypothetical protein